MANSSPSPPASRRKSSRRGCGSPWRRRVPAFPRASVTLKRTMGSSERFHSLRIFFSSRRSLICENSSARLSVSSKTDTLAETKPPSEDASSENECTCRSSATPSSGRTETIARGGSLAAGAVDIRGFAQTRLRELAGVASDAIARLLRRDAGRDVVVPRVLPQADEEETALSQSTAVAASVTMPPAISALRCSGIARPRLDSMGSVRSGRARRTRRPWIAGS